MLKNKQPAHSAPLLTPASFSGITDSHGTVERTSKEVQGENRRQWRKVFFCLISWTFSLAAVKTAFCINPSQNQISCNTLIKKSTIPCGFLHWKRRVHNINTKLFLTISNCFYLFIFKFQTMEFTTSFPGFVQFIILTESFKVKVKCTYCL